MLYIITADYRSNNPHKPKYYVLAENKKEARAKFSALIPWLKIYEVGLVNKDEATDIINHPEKHIIIE